ncbi:hypothetical protein ACFE04_020323 [Oxalis oulophora]
MSKALYNIQSSIFFPCQQQKPFLLTNHQHKHPLLKWHTTNEQQKVFISTSTISASSIKKPRSRKVKSNVELCNEIIEFMTTIGFPEGYVPSLKDFSQHGRNDLANIVRRRGYKLINELLAKSVETWNEESDPIDVKPSVISNPKDNSTVTDVSWPSKVLNAISKDRSNLASDEKTPFEYDSEWLENHSSNSNVDQLLSSDSDSWNSDSEEEKALNNVEGSGAIDLVEGLTISTESTLEENYSSNIRNLPISSENLSLDEKVARFVQSGDLGDTEDFLHSEKHSEQAVGIGNSTMTLNGSMLTKGELGADFEGSQVEASTMEDELEISRLKEMLHQKELQLSRLKKEIEKQELAVLDLQANAETAINKAQELISEKDAELLAVEKSLSLLEEIEIQYHGEGDSVAVTGSFTGWQHFIKMDPQPSTSSVNDPTSSRNSKVWSTMVWLYPGIYEIKFLVDGEWKIDPRIDSVSKGSISNNILRSRIVVSYLTKFHSTLWNSRSSEKSQFEAISSQMAMATACSFTAFAINNNTSLRLLRSFPTTTAFFREESLLPSTSAFHVKKPTTPLAIKKGELCQVVDADDDDDDDDEAFDKISETNLYSIAPLPLLLLAALPGASTVTSLFEPFVELIKSWNLPDWLVHWGHPGNMAVVLFAMGGYGTYLGFRIRFSDDVEEKAKAKDLHPKLLGGMFFFFALGATGGVTSLLTSDKPIFESPHAVTGFIGLSLLTLQAILPALFEGNPGLRNVHGVLGSGIMTLFLLHAYLGLQLGLSY